MTPEDVNFVCLFYEPKRLKNFVSVIQKLQSYLQPAAIIFVVNNAAVDVGQLKKTVSVLHNCTVIRHDNRGMEFGGYQAGIDRLQNNALGLLVVNDTVGFHDFTGPKKLKATADLIKSKPKSNFAVGDVCVGTHPIRIEQLESMVWIRSNFFYMDSMALKSIDNRLYYPDIDKLINENSPGSPFVSDIADTRVASLINQWLFEPGPNAWYGAKPLSSANWNSMARKARSILQERYVTMQLIAAGTNIHDAWLSPRSMIYDKLVWRVARATSK